MSNDMRSVKFKMVIKDIWEGLSEDSRSLTDNLGELLWNEGWGTAWLAIIYDYDKLNDYGKIIMEQVCELDEEEFEDEGLPYREDFVKNCKDMEYRMRAAKALVVKLNEEDKGKDIVGIRNKGKDGKIYFIFWSLMILAVDDANKEDYLSLICDFSKMLKISDEEMMGIVQIIRAIYHAEKNLDISPKDVSSQLDKIIKKKSYGGNQSLLDGYVSGILGGYFK